MIESDKSARSGVDAPGAGTEARPESEEIDNDEHARFVMHLFERHRDSLMRYVTGLMSGRSEPEEIVQETFLRLLNTRNLEYVEHRARAYMYRTATNLAYDRFRKIEERQLEARESEAGLAVDDATPELMADMAQSLEIIERTLFELKPRRRRVFLLRVSDGLDYDRIASTLGVSRRTVEREMRYALDTVQKRLNGRGS